jgi:hypothetical protein
LPTLQGNGKNINPVIF